MTSRPADSASGCYTGHVRPMPCAPARPPELAASRSESLTCAPDTTAVTATHHTPDLSSEEWLITAEVAQQYELSVGALRDWRHIGDDPAPFAASPVKRVSG